MILIKSFTKGTLYDHFNLIYMYLSEGDKIRECYSYLKLMIQARCFFSQNILLNKFPLYDSIDIKICYNRVKISNKARNMKYFAIKPVGWNFLLLLIQEIGLQLCA